MIVKISYDTMADNTGKRFYYQCRGRLGPRYYKCRSYSRVAVHL